MSGGHGLGCVEEILERIILPVKKNLAMLSNRHIMGVINLTVKFMISTLKKDNKSSDGILHSTVA